MFFPTAEIKNDNGRLTIGNIRKIITDQGNDYTTDCLLDSVYFKNHYKMIAINLNKQRAADANPKAIQNINFTGNLNRAGGKTIFFIIEEANKIVLDFQ